MLEAIPSDFFGSNFRLQQQDKLLGEVSASMWRCKARLELEDGTYELHRDGAFRGDFLIERNGNVVARATKPSALRSKFEIELPNRHLVLRKLSVWNRRFGLFDGAKQIGSIYPLGMFSRRAKIDLPAEWPLPTKVFLFWLVLLMWKQEQAAAA
jgi:hypothetical protein